MSEPTWITVAIATAIHDEAIYEFGGLSGIRDQGLLESALDRPRNLLSYEPDSSLFQLAASLCIGLAKNHPFNDGNKRTALLATRAFLFLNGRALEPRQDDEVATLVAVAAGSLGEPELATWLEANSEAVD
ncbi:MAG: type II toxin-antitoxin system death-on-curing family toxin [Gammaproteobacteria bacterium]|nr:type II toxin-antitoxin system death-on-curing family toxin [Gammaproteobacteria bacterium]